MIDNNLTGWGTEEQRRQWRALDRNDLYGLQVARISGFGIAVFVIVVQLVAFFLQQEMDSAVEANARLWGLGGLALGFVCGEVIKLKRRIAALEKRLRLADEGGRG
jgi:hypothetical protein